MASEYDVRVGREPDARYYRVTADGDQIVRIEAAYYNSVGKRTVYRELKRDSAAWRRAEREFRNPTPHPAAGKAPRGVPGWRPTIATSKGENNGT
jgi:hypothetical protein